MATNPKLYNANNIQCQVCPLFNYVVIENQYNPTTISNSLGLSRKEYHSLLQVTQVAQVNFFKQKPLRDLAAKERPRKGYFERDLADRSLQSISVFN